MYISFEKFGLLSAYVNINMLFTLKLITED